LFTHLKSQIPTLFSNQVFCAAKAELYSLWVTVWSYQKVALEPVVTTMPDQVNTRPHAALGEASVRWKIRSPFTRVVSEKVIYMSGQTIGRRKPGSLLSANEFKQED
jgi:hypothetical protein